MPDTIELLCYCGSGKAFSDCCQPFIKGQQHPKSCEQLMRSRYSAFCCAALAYLQQSCTKDLAIEQSPEHLHSFVSQVHFTGLSVLPLPERIEEAGTATDQQQGFVYFQVWYLHQQKLHSFRELSRFVWQQGWRYAGGEVVDLPSSKPSRNDPCPCGSGRKLKACTEHRPSGQAA